MFGNQVCLIMTLTDSVMVLIESCVVLMYILAVMMGVEVVANIVVLT